MQKLSVSRQFSRWTHTLRYEDLPAEVVDKIKALSLHALCSAVLGANHDHANHVVDLTLAEEGKPDGARILGRPERATRVGAAFANAELMHASNLYDSYRMLTHPGPVVVPAAIVNADLEKKAGRDVIVALAAGYELSCRLCDQFIPSTAARGFRPSPIYSTLAASLVTGKLLGLNEDGLVTAIALGANFASGLNEGPRVGTNEISIHEPQAARNGVFAGVIARQGAIKGAETSIEGEAGFYNAFTGSSNGELTYAFRGPLQVDPTAIADGLGREYKLLTAMFRMYACPGYNQPVIDLMTEMKAAHGLHADDIADVAVAMNWIETLYPSPAFPRFPDFQEPRIGETKYYVAHAAVNGGYPVVGGRTFGPTGPDLVNDERVLAFMKERVRLVPQKDRAMFSPEITVTMKNGTSHVKDYPYQRMEWNFDQLAARLDACFPQPGLARMKFEGLVELARNLDRLDSLDAIFALLSRQT
jgi:2-methylcitrate dehydratase PrpD